MTAEPTLGQLIFVLSLGALWLASMAVQVYGVYLSFCKKWYVGLASLVFPGFAFVIGIAKLFKKDLLK